MIALQQTGCGRASGQTIRDSRQGRGHKDVALPT